MEKTRGANASGHYLKKIIALAMALLILLWAAVGVRVWAADTQSITVTPDTSGVAGTLFDGLSFTDGGSFYTYSSTASNGGTGTVVVSCNDSSGTIVMTATDAEYTTDGGCDDDTYAYYVTTVVLTITNTGSYSTTIQYSTEVSASSSGTASTGSLTVSGSSGSSASSGILVIDGGSSATLTLTSRASADTSASSASGYTTTTATISISSVTTASSAYITFNSSDYADYSVSDSNGGSTEDGTISLDERVETAADTTFTLTLDEDSVSSGYVFAGWVEGSTGTLLSSETVYEGAEAGSESYSIQPCLVPSDSALYYIESVGTGTMYYCLDHAITAAGSSGTIVMYGNDSNTTGTVYGSLGQTEFTIPSGVTLLLPYDQDDLEIGDSSDGFGSYDNCTLTSSTSSSKALYPEVQNVLNLTVLEGTTIYVEGGLVIGGTLQANANNPSAATSGNHANLYLEGDLIVNSGGVVSVCGYILGDGSVTCQDGSTVYQPLVVLDFRGGSWTAATAGNVSDDWYMSFVSSYLLDPFTDEDYVMPFNRYTVQNIETDLDMVSGAIMKVYADLYAGSQHNTATGIMIGSSSSSGIITLSDGATLHSEYDPETTASSYTTVGRTSLTITGGASLGSLTLNISLGTVLSFDLSFDLDTSDFIFSLPYNYDIHLEGSGSEYTIANDMAILPGATVTVGEGATLNVTSKAVLLVYDGLEDYSAVSSSTAISVTYSETHTTNSSSYSYVDYPVGSELQAAGLSACGELIVNGTLNLGTDGTAVTFAGLVQTTESYDTDTGTGPVIHVGSSAVLSFSAQVGATGEANCYCAGATVYDLTAEVMDPTVGIRAVMEAGETYYGITGSYDAGSLTFTLYPDSADTSDHTEYTIDLNQAVQGAWWNITAAITTVFSDQTVASSRTAYFVSSVDLTGQGYYEDIACTTEATSVEQDGTLYALVVARLESTEDGESTTTYYESLAGAVGDADAEGDKVVLMADLTGIREVSTTVGISSGQNFTLYLYDYVSGDVYDIDFSTLAFSNSGTVVIALNKASSVATTSAVPFVQNQEGGVLTLNLNGATLNVSNTDNAESTTEAIVNYGTMTVDLGGGSIVVDCPVSLSVASEAVYSTGSLTIQDSSVEDSGDEGGTISYSGISTSSFSTTGTAEYFAAVIRSEGEDAILSVSSVKLSESETSTYYSAGIVNSGGSTITALTDVDIETGGYTLYNLGSTVTLIDGGTWSGYYGLLNQNVSSGSGSSSSPYETDSVGTIEVIRDTSMTASCQYALWNSGIIGTIDGSASFSAPTYTFYNSYGWYVYNSFTQTGYSDSGLERTYVYDNDNIPTITSITGNVRIETTSSDYALYNRGSIGEISGSATIYSSDGYALCVVDGGYVGGISGNVTVRALTDRAIQVSGYRNSSLVRTYSDSLGGTVEVNKYTYQISKIGNIQGDMEGEGITIMAKAESGYTSDNTYTVYVEGEVGDISGKVALSGYQYVISLQSAGANSACTQYYADYFTDDSYTDSDSTSVSWDSKQVYEYTRSTSTVGMIGGTGSDEITIEAYYNRAVNCFGDLKGLGSGVTICKTSGSDSTASGLVYVGPNASQTSCTQTYYLDTDDYTYEDGYSLTRYEQTYEYQPASIGVIDGAVIISASDLSGLVTSDPTSVTLLSSMVIQNYGSIGSITDSVIWGSGTSVSNIYNGSYAGSRTVVSYYLAESTTFSTSSSYLEISSLNTGYSYTSSSIGTIDDCNIYSSGSYAIYNGGTIGTITDSTITAKSSYAICNGYTSWYGYMTSYSLDGLTYEPEYDDDGVLSGYTYSETGTTTTYAETVIDTIGWGNTITAADNAIYNRGTINTIGGAQTEGSDSAVTTVEATAGTAINNYSGVYTKKVTYDDGTSTAYSYSDGPSIGLISNVEVSATSYAIYQGGDSAYSVNGNSYIGELGEGLVAWTTGSDKTAVYCNTRYECKIGAVTGGDYRSGTDSRSYSIYDVDEQIYPEGYTMSYVTESVTLSDGTTESGFYFITQNGFTLVFQGGDDTTGSVDSQFVSLTDTTASVTVNGNGFTKTSSGEWSFLGWAAAEDSTDSDVTAGDSYTVADLVSALEKALEKAGLEDYEIGAGSTVTLYAVWERSDADVISVTVTWGDMHYEYTAASYVWDGESMQFIQTGTESWTATALENSDSTLDPGLIRISNSSESTISISVGVDFTDGTAFGLTMDYVVQAGLTSTETSYSAESDYEDPFSFSPLGSGEYLTLSAVLSGTPKGSSSSDTEALGTITVTILAVESGTASG